MPSPAELLEPILEAARQQGMDQSGLARAAGLSPESISRAKRRPSMDLSTLASLADAAGMTIRVEPKRIAAPTRPAPAKPLADPSWGLAWSNPDGISDAALIRAALHRGNFTVVLEACARYGVERVLTEWHDLVSRPEAGLGRHQIDQVERILRNIRQAHGHAAA